MAIAATLTDNGPSCFQVEDDTEITVLDMAVNFTYQIPSLSVFQVNLRQVEIQVAAEDGSVLCLILSSELILCCRSYLLKTLLYTSKLKIISSFSVLS